MRDLFHRSNQPGYKSNLQFGSYKDQWSPGEVDAFKQMTREDGLRSSSDSTSTTNSGDSTAVASRRGMPYVSNNQMKKFALNNQQLLLRKEISRRMREHAEKVVQAMATHPKRKKFIKKLPTMLKESIATGK